MPATEQTWRDSKLLHVVFGVSSLLMLLATVWMLAADHRREWKGYQRQFRDVETWSTQALISQANNERYATERTRLIEELRATQLEVPPADLIEEFKAEVTRDFKLRQEVVGSRPAVPNFDRLDAAFKALAAAPDAQKPDRREDLLIELDMFVVDARFREATLSLQKKSTAAEFDVERSNIGIAVDNNAPQSEIDRLQKQTDAVKERLAVLTQQVQDAISHRKNLEQYVVRYTAHVSEARKRLAAHEATLVGLNKALYEREDNWGKELLAMPIIDAFGRPLKVDQIWLPKLTINNNFRDVARFDRCTTCHQGMDKTAPGSATEPGYRPEHVVTTTLATPAEAPEVATTDADKNELSTEEIYKNKLEKFYGIQISKIGLLHDNDVTISVVRPESPAAMARIQVGDVITYIGDVKILDRPMALGYLVDNVEFGKPLALTLRRGLPNPFTSHPRLDLFVGSLSPHKMAEVGCTICHEGLGSATEFKFASHTPNDPRQADDWKREHGWFNNHHWIFPMNPQRFAESSCLKCHHEVVELEKSERFPEPPAPKLTEGYNVIRQYGCFGCHEINGYDGPNRRIGPDMRAEPNFSAAAQALLATGELSAQQAAWAKQVAFQPEDDVARHDLLESIRSAILVSAEKPGADKAADEKAGDKPKPVAAAVRKLSGLLDDVESPGKLRKVGPGLRHVASKLDYDFLYSWIRRPKDFRPSTKMPQFFGLTEHLSGPGLEASEKFEPIEIRGVTEYLLGKSQPFKFAKLPTEEPSAERGKKAFETRGCLACHQHKDFPKAEMSQGPDLSLIGAKLKRKGNRNAEEPEGWLYSWLRDPSNYHPRTLMPNLKLDPIRDAEGVTTHPADDIAAYLLSGDGWAPTNIPPRKLDAAEQEALEELALDHLKNVFPLKEAKAYLETGIPESRASELKGDEVELLGKTDDPEKLAAKKLLYVGRRTISKYGCAGCHDIPGFEDAKPIGTGLADWGRKAADKLAFEQIGQYILQGHGAHGPGADAGTAQPQMPLHDSVKHDAKDLHAAEESHAEGHHEIKYQDLDPTTGFFLKSLMGHERTGFIWQKLRAPRSYDFMKTENKGYNERLRMPLFNISEQQRESVIAFVLGLLAEPPAAQYVYQPTPRRKALIEGQRVVEKFNCGGCHTLQMDQWKLAYQPGDFSDPSPIADYPQLTPHFTPQQINASLASDVRGLRHATLTGMPVVSPETGEPVIIDEDGAPIDPEDKTSRAFYSFMPWDNVLLNGQIRPAGVQNLIVPASAIDKKYAAEGGYLPKLIYPVVVADERKVNPNAKADEAWGWLPPPLVGEGRKVQSAWLHDFLLDPFPIRPAVVLRMPKFNMSSAEASALAAYFAAVDNVQYPYDFDQRQRSDYLAEQDKEHPHRLGDALKIVTDNNYCIKCHLVGDFVPSGSDRAKAPRLDQVYKRLRPDYVSPWIANPKRILPYTGMPVNIPFDKPVSQELYHGTSEQQLSAVVDLLLNYDRYTESQTPIKSLIKAPPAAGAAEADADKDRAQRDAKPAVDAGDDQAAR